MILKHNILLPGASVTYSTYYNIQSNMSNIITFWLYSRNSKEFPIKDSPVRLHKFSETPQMAKPNKKFEKSPRLFSKHFSSSLNSNRDLKEKSFEAKAMKIFKHNHLYRDLKKNKKFLPPIKKPFYANRVEDSEEEDKTIQDFLKQWNYI